MPYNVFDKLYESMAWSVISYGAALRGNKTFSFINAAHNRAMRFFSGHRKIHSEVKKISNDQELYNQIPHPALKTKREITKYINWRQFTKGTRGKPNEQLFPK